MKPQEGNGTLDFRQTFTATDSGLRVLERLGKDYGFWSLEVETDPARMREHYILMQRYKRVLAECGLWPRPEMTADECGHCCRTLLRGLVEVGARAVSWFAWLKDRIIVPRKGKNGPDENS